jgi:Tol biopolymer transport system component
MNPDDGFDRHVATWLHADAQQRVPQHLDVVLRRTRAERQRPAWSSLERWLPVQATTRFAPVPRFGWILALIAAAVLLGGLLALVASRPRLPTPFGPAADGVSAFSVGGDIYTLDPATGIQTRIIAGPDEDTSPAFSLDGTRIGFHRATGPDAGVIMVAAADGTHPYTVTAPLLGVSRGFWSPNGSTIVVISLIDGVPSLTVAETAAGRRSATLDLGLRIDEVTWRPPDGRELVFRGRDPTGRTGTAIYAVHPDGTNLRRLTATGEQLDTAYQSPAISPDGRTLAYASWDFDTTLRIHTLDLDAGQERILPNRGPRDYLAQPVYSPDGRWLLVERNDLVEAPPSAGEASVVLVPADGSALGRQLGPTFGFRPGDEIGLNYRFSADGATVLIIHGDDGTLWSVPIDGGTGSSQPWSGEELPAVQRLAP